METNSISTSLAAQEAAQEQTAPASGLGTNTFLTLLVVQLRAQNPLEPMDPTEFTAQLAQFNTLEQLISIRQTLEAIANDPGNAELARHQ